MKTYTGGCHCGKVRFELKAEELTSAMACNCSICSKLGWLLTAVPGDRFTLLSGEDALSDYQFHRKNIHHVFCTACGVRSFSRGKSPKSGNYMFAVNVRCLDDVDVSKLEIKSFDGKSL